MAQHSPNNLIRERSYYAARVIDFIDGYHSNILGFMKASAYALCIGAGVLGGGAFSFNAARDYVNGAARNTLREEFSTTGGIELGPRKGYDVVGFTCTSLSEDNDKPVSKCIPGRIIRISTHVKPDGFLNELLLKQAIRFETRGPIREPFVAGYKMRSPSEHARN